MNDTNAIRRHIEQWFQRATIDYEDLYVKLYVAYNAWYYEVTGVRNDRQALKCLTHRYGIWAEYCEGQTLASLRPLIRKLSYLTRLNPIGVYPEMPVTIADEHDWKGLIYYWYRVRCTLVHGSSAQAAGLSELHVKLAYETLYVLMSELVRRMSTIVTPGDRDRLEELAQLAQSATGLTPEQTNERDELQSRFIHAPMNLGVDMPHEPRITPFTHLEKDDIIVPIRHRAHAVLCEK